MNMTLFCFPAQFAQFASPSVFSIESLAYSLLSTTSVLPRVGHRRNGHVNAHHFQLILRAADYPLLCEALLYGNIPQLLCYQEQQPSIGTDVLTLSPLLSSTQFRSSTHSLSPCSNITSKG